MSINVKTFFDSDTATFTHVVTDLKTNSAAVIDSVLNYDQYSGRTSTKSADEVIEYIKAQNLKLQWILETHIHADHITASHYIKQKMGGKIAIGARIKEVLKLWVPIFNTSIDTDLDGSQFDKLFEDGEVFKIGSLEAKVMYTPGHTPACATYLLEGCAFVGDTIFMPDIGTARTDFPGGSAQSMFDSVQKILSLPDDTMLYMCHDYPTGGREVTSVITVAQQKQKNVLVNSSISKEEYVKLRNKRDEGKAVPKLLLPSIQTNLRAGTFGEQEENKVHYIKIPVNKI